MRSQRVRRIDFDIQIADRHVLVDQIRNARSGKDHVVGARRRLQREAAAGERRGGEGRSAADGRGRHGDTPIAAQRRVVEIRVVGIHVRDAGEKRVACLAGEVLGRHEGIVGDAPRREGARLDPHAQFLEIVIHDVEPVPAAGLRAVDEQALKDLVDRGGRIERRDGLADPGDILAPVIGGDERIAGRRHALVRLAAAGAGVAERVGGQHPLRLLVGRGIQVQVERERLGRGGGDRARRQPLVQIDAVHGGFGRRVGAGLVRQFQQVLIEIRRIKSVPGCTRGKCGYTPP